MATQSFDLAGRPITTTDPLGHSTSFKYDGDRLVSTINTLGESTSFAYDAVGNRTVITDANGSATYYGYDERNKLKVVTDTINSVTTYSYDANGNRIGVKDALNRLTSYGYDAANRLIQVTDPLSNITRYGYDAIGNRTVITDANGAIINNTYDALNRLVQVTYPDSQVKYAYNSVNNRIMMSDTLGTTYYSYDMVGRPITITTSAGLSVGYSYNSAGQRTGLTYPDNKQVQYGYDGVGRLETVTDWSSHVVTYTHDYAGRLTGAQLPNNTSTAYTYDSANRLTTVSHTSGISGTINSVAYEMDAVGNRRVMTDTAGVTTYTYDGLYRLTGVSYPEGTSVSYQYDSVGNRTTMTDTTAVTSYTYDAADRLQSAGSNTFTWDANGNMKTRVTPAGTITYTHNYANMLTQVVTGTDTYQYAYDGDRTRVRKTINGTNIDYIWDKALSLPVILTDTNSLYLYGLGLISQQSGVDSAYYHVDGLGSVRSLTNSTGQTIVSYNYDAFGGLKSTNGSWANDFRFTGQQADDETGLYYLRARNYDPSTGRFLRKDPFPGYSHLPQSLQKYSYTTNDPVNLVDPSGLDTFGYGLVWELPGLGIGGSGSILLVWDDEENVGILLSGGGGGVTPSSATLGLAYQGTTARNIFLLASPTVYSGPSFGWGLAGGLDFLSSSEKDDNHYVGGQYWFGAGFKVKFLPKYGYHGGVQTGQIVSSRQIKGLNDIIYRSWLNQTP